MARTFEPGSMWNVSSTTMSNVGAYATGTASIACYPQDNYGISATEVHARQQAINRQYIERDSGIDVNISKVKPNTKLLLLED
jgi:hypothetical protein